MKWYDCARCDAGYDSGPLEQECTCNQTLTQIKEVDDSEFIDGLQKTAEENFVPKPLLGRPFMQWDEDNNPYLQDPVLKPVMQAHADVPMSCLREAAPMEEESEEEIKHDRVHKDVGNARPAKVHRVTANEIASAQQMTRKSKLKFNYLPAEDLPTRNNGE